MKKFEYKRFDYTYAMDIEKLNKLGKEGWEVIVNRKWYYLLKRELKDNEDNK